MIRHKPSKLHVVPTSELIPLVRDFLANNGATLTRLPVDYRPKHTNSDVHYGPYMFTAEQITRDDPQYLLTAHGYRLSFHDSEGYTEGFILTPITLRRLVRESFPTTLTTWNNFSYTTLPNTNDTLVFVWWSNRATFGLSLNNTSVTNLYSIKKHRAVRKLLSSRIERRE